MHVLKDLRAYAADKITLMSITPNVLSRAGTTKATGVVPAGKLDIGYKVEERK